MDPLQWSCACWAKAAFAQMDRLRRAGGKVFDAAGFGPMETPYRILHDEAGVKLRRYGGARQAGPALLIVPAPIKRPYIWDLAPKVSVVRRCLGKGMRVYLAEWTPAGAAEQDFGLADYGERLLKACLDAIEADCAETQAVLAAHSLGGVLAAIFACLHPRQVRALLLLEAPLHFGADAGSFAPLVAATPDFRPIAAAFGNVLGSFPGFLAVAAAPAAFQWERCLDWWLSMADAEALRTHLRVERWTHDESPLAERLFTELIELLYREDRLMNGRLCIGGRPIGPRDAQWPLFNVVNPHSTVIPPQSVLPFHRAAASAAKKVLWYEGDIGVGIQHVGVLVGTNAHAMVWPAIFRWLAEPGVTGRYGR